MSLQRFPDWPGRLEQYLLARSGDRFEYGRMDCALFVADAVLAITGVDLAGWFRGQYSSRGEAIAKIRTYTGGGSSSLSAVASAIAGEFEMEPVPILKAQRGDMVIIKRARDYSLGLVALDGRNIAVLSRDRGVWLLPLAMAARAWRV